MPSPCAVTGNLVELTGSPTAGFAVFRLVNFGEAIPRILGNAVIATPVMRTQASTGGVISANLWGNDNIDPTGTFYVLTVEDSFQQPISSYNFLITGASLNLNNATPLTVPPAMALYIGLDQTILVKNSLGGTTTLTFTKGILTGVS